MPLMQSLIENEIILPERALLFLLKVVGVPKNRLKAYANL